MRADSVGLREQRIFIRYESQQKALKFLRAILSDQRGIALLHGPRLSGKSVVINQFVRDVQGDVAIAVVDGARMKTPELLSRILEQFGYNVSLNSIDEMLSMLTVFVVQQTRTYQAPVLVLENINEMFPSALGALCKLASLTTNNKYALRLVLVSDRDISHIIESPSMNAITERVAGNFELGPMTSKEALLYLYAKLRSGGVDWPDDVFSVDVCEKLYSLSGGWPGELDGIAVSIIEQADEYPIRLDDIVDPDSPLVDDTPKLILTQAGETVREIRLVEERALIGRSDLSDIVIDDQFVSQQHALLIRNQDSIVLIDLKSKNGTFVNSRRVQSKVLLNNDIISIGDHRMKMVYATDHVSVEIDDPDLADTAKMKNIADACRDKEQKIPTLYPVTNKIKSQSP